MEQMSNILDEFPNIKVLSDDVYDFLNFDNKPFTPFATVGNNWSRTVTVYSGGKLFNATGWKVGWGIGPKHLMKAAGIVSYASLYCSNTPM